ncbi:hypothetical protein V6N11_072295 [Hibiscus sabdariffa]|uniref:Uncharacterized protein n=1 Tax=Hibiscus sabdariffa TaxID=183260 RepID=A0ABR2U3B9_9ROSI
MNSNSSQNAGLPRYYSKKEKSCKGKVQEEQRPCLSQETLEDVIVMKFILVLSGIHSSNVEVVLLQSVRAFINGHMQLLKM